MTDPQIAPAATEMAFYLVGRPSLVGGGCSARRYCRRFLKRRRHWHLASRASATYVMLGAQNRTMLSHAPASQTIPARSFDVFQAPTLSALITAIRPALRLTPRRTRTHNRTITLAAVASCAEIHRYAAARAEKTADGLLRRRTTLSRRTISKAALGRHYSGSPAPSSASPRCGKERSLVHPVPWSPRR